MVYSRSQFRSLFLSTRCGNSSYPYVCLLFLHILNIAHVAFPSLSWADTAASTIGRLFGSYTPKLPSRVPFLRLPLAPRKSLAGFLAASVTGACIAFGFWGWIAGMRNGGRDVTWSWDGGVRGYAEAKNSAKLGLGAGGPLELLVIAIVAGVVSGVAEALGALLNAAFFWFLGN